MSDYIIVEDEAGKKHRVPTTEDTSLMTTDRALTIASIATSLGTAALTFISKGKVKPKSSG